MFGSEDSKTDRRERPHHATITMKIDIRQINKEGTLGHDVMGNRLLEKYGISTKAQFCVSGSNEAACIDTIKKKLEQLNG